jgi:alanine racemase
MKKTQRTKIGNKNKTKTCKLYEIPKSDKDIHAQISIKSLKHNLHFLKKSSGTDIMPVLKANAYGHGIINMAKNLRNLKTKYLGVATVGEAILLRKNGDKGRILAWLYDVDSSELKDAFELDIDIAIFDETHIPKIEKMVPKGKKAKITMHIDTGINRASIPYNKAFQAAIDVNNSNKFELVGLMSHLVCSEIRNSPIVNEQLRKFRELRKRLEEVNIVPPLVHIANTGGCLNYDVSDFTLARSGTGTYGLSPDNKMNKNLIPIMTVKSVIIQIKEIDKGEGIGYNSRYITPRNMKVGIVPIGYADVIPRATSLKLHVYINGKKRKVLGMESMDQIVIEVKDEDKLHDNVIIFGNGKNCVQTVYDLAHEANMTVHEIVVHIGNRVNLEYIYK